MKTKGVHDETRCYEKFKIYSEKKKVYQALNFDQKTDMEKSKKKWIEKSKLSWR